MRPVFVDTNVLFPFSIMDLFLALTEAGLHQVVWTDELLDEWERVIVREHGRSAASATAITSTIREVFGDLRIDPSLYRHLIDQMPGPDPDDHVHSAAALAANATALVTNDTKGFPVRALAELGLRVVDPDTYLEQLYAELPHDVLTTIVELARTKTRPPLGPSEILTWSRRCWKLPEYRPAGRLVLTMVLTPVIVAVVSACSQTSSPCQSVQRVYARFVGFVQARPSRASGLRSSELSRTLELSPKCSVAVMP